MIETQKLKELYAKIDMRRNNFIWYKKDILYFLQHLIEKSESQDESQEKSGD